MTTAIKQEQALRNIWGKPPHSKSADRLMRAQVLTTGQTALVCRVAPRTVSKWIDSGMLHGYRIPGSHDRRVKRAVLLAFMQEHHLPTDLLEVPAAPPFRVLLVGRDERLSAAVRAFIAQSSPQTECAAVVDFFSAGAECERLRPDVVVCDFSMGREGCDLLRYGLRRREEECEINESLGVGEGRRKAKLVAVVGEDEPDEQPGWDECFKKPFDPELLATVVTGARFRGEVG